MSWFSEFYNFRVVWQYFPQFMEGLWTTVWVSAVCLLLSLILGGFVALMRMSSNPYVWRPAAIYIQSVRATPLIVQIYILYYGLSNIPVLDVSVPAIICGILALTLHTTAYMSEIFRAGIESVSKGQWEGALSLGMSRGKTFIHVIYPQAFVTVLPPLIGQASVLIKDSSLLSFITVMELMSVGLVILSDRVMPVESFITPALFYLAIYTALVLAAERVKNVLGGKGKKSVGGSYV
ncbi:amino acid ABC transporter permease [Aliamphritea hakodatensis]|uniref:amino acid ABC transporter permease n=1 Tax=Aliamphritea hakodatensis TaxID=2895352 RepID=UPI0022FD3ACA|nr:amino acid ABC transporter permease [Aliamphritea hakodatensis]